MRKALSMFSAAAVAVAFSAFLIGNAEAAASCGNAGEDLCRAYPNGICGFVYEGRAYCYPGYYINYYEQ